MNESDDQAPESSLAPSPRMWMASDEVLADALRRMAIEQLRVMLGAFGNHSDDAVFDHVVHSGRKSSKRLRALIRLCRDQLGTETYQWANALVRDQSRRLSSTRTSKVVLVTLDELVAHGVAPAEVADLRSAAVDRHAAHLAALRTDSEGRHATRAALAALEDRIEACPTPAAYERVDLVALAPAVRRSYRRARRAMSLALESETVEAFHDWRKRVNYLRYQMEALAGACADPIGQLADTLDDLSEVLGSDHDLADLLQVAGEMEVRMTPALVQAIDVRSNVLRTTAADMGSNVFAATPRLFARVFLDNVRTLA